MDFVAPDYRKAPAEYIAHEYKLLIEEIQRRNTSIKVIVSAILPRLFDFGSNKGYWSKVNSEIKDMCDVGEGCYYINSYTAIM